LLTIWQQRAIIAMTNEERRQKRFDEIKQKKLDLIVIGGGITGAGILHEAARAGLKSALFEAKDFAWGTSSRSSKMVHGGLRYLAQGQFDVMRECVTERERLLKEAPGLVDPLLFLVAVYGSHFRRLSYEVGLSVYDLFAGRRTHSYYAKKEFLELAPGIRTEGMIGGFSYEDAQTDDARLVLRVLDEAERAGAVALNYAPVVDLLFDGGKVAGVEIKDNVSAEIWQIRAPIVVNATGAQTDHWRTKIGAKPVIRPLRGSHIVFRAARLPIPHVVAFGHPFDGRNVFACPWNQHVFVGTTDLDHSLPLDLEPRIAVEELSYLMAAANYAFPDLALEIEDVTSTWAGVRPVIGSGKAEPSKESRDALIQEERGLFSVAGGKLTTFRSTAHEVLERVARQLGTRVKLSGGPLFRHDTSIALPANLPDSTRRRLTGQYGSEAIKVIKDASASDLEEIPDANFLWTELRYAARNGDVVHLEDLLLRRARFGFTLRHGGANLLDRVRTTVQSELAWNDQRWQEEERNYLKLIDESYSVPTAESVPDWKKSLTQSKRGSQR
jgi:glycerol-3-phosphate dehydrogenase